jgi:hypothetical protein
MPQRSPDDLFERITANVGYLKVFDFLGLQMKPANSPTAGQQYRGSCPVCNRGGDRILVYTISRQSWCCHSPVCSPEGQRKKGGDIIGLVAHVHGIKQTDAATLLQDQFLREPEKPKPKKRLKRPGNLAPTSTTNRRRTGNKIVDAPVGGTGEAYSIAHYIGLES